MWGYNSVTSIDAARRRGHLRAAAAGAALALLLAACSGDEEALPPQGADVAAEAPVEQPDDGSGDISEESAADPADDTEPGEGSSDTPAEDEAATQDEGSAAEQASGGGDGSAGTVTIAGVDYGINEALLCEEFDEDIGVDLEREVELFARADDGAALNIYVEEIAGFPSHSVSWQGPEGVFSMSASDFGDGWLAEATDPIDGPPIEVDGDTIRSTFPLTLIDGMGGSEEVEVTFEVDMPDGTFACR